MNKPSEDETREPAIADGLDVAAVMLLEPQVKALSEAIKTAMPAAERLAKASPDALGLLCDHLRDAVEENGMGTLASILDAFDALTVLLVVDDRVAVA
jgi:hypothetical protein